MSKNIRQKIVQAIQTTFRSTSSSSSPQDKHSSLKSKISTCCSVTKPKDYEYLSYQPKQSSTNNDYVDLSECHSWSSSSSSSSRDSGISIQTNISSISSSHQNFHQLQSTRTLADDSCSLSTLSDLSYIPHDQMNISKFDVTAWHSVSTSFECCHCQCHHLMSNDLLRNEMKNYSYIPEQSRQNRTKNNIFPFVL